MYIILLQTVCYIETVAVLNDLWRNSETTPNETTLNEDLLYYIFLCLCFFVVSHEKYFGFPIKIYKRPPPSTKKKKNHGHVNHTVHWPIDRLTATRKKSLRKLVVTSCCCCCCCCCSKNHASLPRRYCLGRIPSPLERVINTQFEVWTALGVYYLFWFCLCF